MIYFCMTASTQGNSIANLKSKFRVFRKTLNMMCDHLARLMGGKSALLTSRFVSIPNGITPISIFFGTSNLTIFRRYATTPSRVISPLHIWSRFIGPTTTPQGFRHLGDVCLYPRIFYSKPLVPRNSWFSRFNIRMIFSPFFHITDTIFSIITTIYFCATAAFIEVPFAFFRAIFLSSDSYKIFMTNKAFHEDNFITEVR